MDNNDFLKSLNITSLKEKNIKGKGIKVAVIDTGGNSFDGNLVIKGGYNFIEKSNNYKDVDGHGTAVASIISSNNYGVVPESDVYSLKVDLSLSNEVVINQVIDGLKWCIDNKMDIVNMSFGFPDCESDELEAVCLEAKKKGIVLVCAAGNTSINAYLPIPARYDSTIAISSVDKNNIISKTSSYSFGIDFCCYGENIVALDQNGKNITVSGTSFSSAITSGIIALIKQQNSNLTFREIYEILKDNCIDLGDKGKDLYYGYGLIQASIVPTNYKREDELILEDIQKNIYFPQTKLQVQESNQINANIVFLPNEMAYVKFKTTDESIATVSDGGIITGKKVGSTNLIATYNNKAAVCEVDVVEYVTNDSPPNVSTTDLFNFEDLNVYKLHNAGIKGKGIKIAYLGYGCISTDKINVTKYNDITSEKSSFVDSNGYGTVYTSLISGKLTGLAPECEIYVIKESVGYATKSYTNCKNAVEWCIANKIDIINFDNGVQDTVADSLLKKCYDANIICVTNGGGWVIGPQHKSIYSLTVNYVTPDKKFISGDNNKTPFTGNFVDCVSYGYGVTCVNSKNQYDIYEIGTNPHKIFLCDVAVMQVMGLLALLKQQDPTINNAVKVRSLLPKLCEPLYGGRNDNTGYGLLKADILQ
ncbi:S8 family serine peptidase [Clostridium saccharobutylicum]|uniref:Subtilisin BL n=1 Tax=Clostridium saccharobutylicum DSM 13864 TaxID=1345695 RepID=U5MVZ0_CLOSA|nr:S8 family serine peptidase [Clostridium saccharobutylicum]AGX43806.1 subtilisin BL [Clostridium saccharobutylicum DSM 13864]AQR91106.1 minor extracellular protease Epr precursor [Clostridium saccharobutylicum]AQS01010.1 minor extracellular protease Epr precursor [Clostridium saccharobutylicum]AQS10749.1 minor extracellular protease Epr precursor [Clostridium saccharobutylicum]AQS14993.1 minor extracellular protease Epr precursor [Clostridium saccharobutylicum]